MAKHYRIIIQPEAYEGLESGYLFIKDYAPKNALEWAKGMINAINSLENFALRCPLASEDAFFSQEIRQLLYGKGLSSYRILFTVADDTVSILHIRHGSQDIIRQEPDN